MARIVLDPDDVNQGVEVTLTDGSVVELANATRAQVGRVARQLARYASVYADAFRAPDVQTAEKLAHGELTLAQVAPLHQAVARRHQVLRDEPGRGADDIDPTALLDDHRWTTGSGTVKRLGELTPSHRENLLGWLERHSDALEAAARDQLTSAERAAVRPASPWVAGTPLYRALRAHQAATDATELAKDEARQVARRIAFQTTGRWPTD